VKSVTDAIRKATRLQAQLDALRQDFGELRKELEQLQAETPAPAPGADGGVDCLAAAVALAQDLGTDFSSDDPHSLCARGEDWPDPT
jgi:hypothetical protein